MQISFETREGKLETEGELGNKMGDLRISLERDGEKVDRKSNLTDKERENIY